MTGQSQQTGMHGATPSERRPATAPDSVSFALETDRGMWAAQAPPEASSHVPGARTFATPRFIRFREVGGRLIGLLDGAAGTERTLH